jgi:hypothetical protein
MDNGTRVKAISTEDGNVYQKNFLGMCGTIVGNLGNPNFPGIYFDIKRKNQKYIAGTFPIECLEVIDNIVSMEIDYQTSVNTYKEFQKGHQ